MRIVFLSLLLTASTIAGRQNPPTTAPKEKKPFTLVLSSEKQRVDVGTRVMVELLLTNTSNHDIPVGFWGSYGVTDTLDTIQVRDGHGNLLTRKTGPDTQAIAGDLHIPMTLKPGQSRPCLQDYRRWFDLSRPDTYTIQVSRPYAEDGKEGVVRANTLTITITLADPVKR
jgi:hypothetical protein